MDLEKILSLANPIQHSKDASADSRITTKVEGFQEGNIVQTKGWLQLVALEDDSKNHQDGDYHVQITTTSDPSSPCLIVEIPFADFLTDPELKNACNDARSWIKSNLLKNQEPSKSQNGSKMIHPVYVSITGQLFFDAHHLMNTGESAPRGKGGMHSKTCWEVHPVFHLAFTPKPSGGQ